MAGDPVEARRPWEGRRVVLGVAGGVAAYKAVQVARDLTLLGCRVDAVLTRSATEFVRPLLFEAVTGRPAHTSLWDVSEAALHIRLAREADAVCVAPATADLLARAAHGRADDLLTTLLLATDAPVVLCPAMNDRMWAHAQVRANAAHCRDALGYALAGPVEGRLAAGEGAGPGRMLEPADIVEWVGRALGSDEALEGRRVLVTAGPTRERLDPVRYVGNHSSGRMGWALARAAWRRGAEVTMVAGPVAMDDPTGVEVVRVESAEEMRDAVAERLPRADAAVFAAAVADYRPARPSEGKMKRSSVGGGFELELTANPDVAADTRDRRAPGAYVVGFALETEDLVERARGKMEAKGFDLVVANPAVEPGAGFGAPTNRVTLVDADGAEALPLLSKDEVAERILDRVAAALGER